MSCRLLYIDYCSWEMCKKRNYWSFLNRKMLPEDVQTKARRSWQEWSKSFSMMRRNRKMASQINLRLEVSNIHVYILTKTCVMLQPYLRAGTLLSNLSPSSYILSHIIIVLHCGWNNCVT